MSILYCHHCKKAVESKKAIIHQGIKHCPDCHQATTVFGMEHVQVSSEYKFTKHLPTKPDLSIKGSNKIYLQNQAPDPIIVACQDTLSQNPDDFESLFLLGQIFFTQKKIKQSKHYIKKALLIDPSHVKLLSFIQKFFPELFPKQFKEDFSHDIEKAFKLAQLKLDLNHKKEAERLLKKVTQMNSNHIGARRLLAELYLEAQQFKDAIRELNVIRSQKPDDPYIIYNIGIACLNDENPKRALACFKEARLKSTESEFLNELSQLIQAIESSK